VVVEVTVILAAALEEFLLSGNNGLSTAEDGDPVEVASVVVDVDVVEAVGGYLVRGSVTT
jgi:hypothetical protein